MGRIRSLIVAFITTVVLGGSAFAIVVSTQTYTGLADFSGAGSIAFSFTLKNVSGNANATRINWNTTNAFNTTGIDKWVRADQYAVVAATVTKAGFNVYMYQTNGNSTVYKATAPRTNKDESKVYSGLVRKGSGGGEHRGYVPIAYSFVSAIDPTITFTQETSTISENRADRYFCDIKDTKADGETPRSSTGRDNYTLIASLCGPVFDVDIVNGPWTGKDVEKDGKHTAYMYFFGNFKNIVGGDVYGTDQLHIVQVTE